MKKKMIEVVRYLKDMDKERDLYLATVPGDLKPLLLDNQYVDLLEIQKDRLINALFKKHTEEVYWFLYEYDENKQFTGPHIIQEDGTPYTFQSNEDYYLYLKELP